MNREVLEYLMNKDYKELIEVDGFSPAVAEQIVYIRFLNGVYDTDNRIAN